MAYSAWRSVGQLSFKTRESPKRRGFGGLGTLVNLLEEAQTIDGRLPVAHVDQIALASNHLSPDEGRAVVMGIEDVEFPDFDRVDRYFLIDRTVDDLFYPNRAEREDYARPTPRDVLTDVLTDPRYHGLTRADDGPRHLVVVQATAFDDASSIAHVDLAAFEKAVTSQSGGVSFISLRPLSPAPRPEYGPWSMEDEGHQITEELIAPYLLEVVDLCDPGRYGNPLRAHHGWTNAIDIELDHEPLPESLRVFGVAEGATTELPLDQWALDPDTANLLQVGPPLFGYSAVRVQYEYEVE